MRRLVVWVLISVWLLSSGGLGGSTSTPPATAEEPDRVAQLMATMTPRQKVGQLFMVTLFGTRLLESNARFIDDYAPGAVALFGSNLDYQSAAETTELVNAMQGSSVEAHGIPMIIATDQEGGRVWRLINGFTHFPEPMYLGAMSAESAYLVGTAFGREMRAVGVNMNLAPVADLTTRDDALNKYRVMNTRTMGQDPVIVGTNAAAYIQGMSAEGVMGVVKHFPGHSPTTTDSHRDLAQVDIDRATFEQTNLLAFRTAVEGGAEVIMLGHLYYPAIEPETNLPATLSPTMVRLLREDVGFDGVIMTDAFDMGAIQNYYDPAEAAVMAFQAGIDMIAMGPNLAFSKQKLMMERTLQAVENGEISMERLDEAVERILRLKEKYGILDWEPLDSATVHDRIDRPATSAIMQTALADATTIARDSHNVLPLSNSDNVAILHPAGWFDVASECRAHFPDATYLGYSYTPARWELGAAVDKARNADVVVVFVENLYLNDGQRDLVNLLPMDKTIVVAMGSPYDYELLNSPSAGYIVGYASLPEAQIAVCRVLAGEAQAGGRLPVALDGLALGAGVMMEIEHD